MAYSINNEIQTVLDDKEEPLYSKDGRPVNGAARKEWEARKEKEVIELIDSLEEEEDQLESIMAQECTECNKSIVFCKCYEDSMDDIIDTAELSYSDDSESDCSDDLRDI